MHGHMNVEILFCVYTKLFRHIPPQVETVEEKQAYDLNNYLNTRSVPMVGHHSSESLYSVWTKSWARRNTFKIDAVYVRWTR